MHCLLNRVVGVLAGFLVLCIYSSTALVFQVIDRSAENQIPADQKQVPPQTFSSPVTWTDIFLDGGESVVQVALDPTVDGSIPTSQWPTWIPILQSSGTWDSRLTGKQAVMYQCRNNQQIQSFMAPWWPDAEVWVREFYRMFAETIKQRPDRSVISRLLLSLGPSDEWRFPVEHDLCWFSADAQASLVRFLSNRYTLSALNERWGSSIGEWADVSVNGTTVTDLELFYEDLQLWYTGVLQDWGAMHLHVAQAELGMLGIPFLVKFPAVPIQNSHWGLVAGYGSGSVAPPSASRLIGRPPDYRPAFRPFVRLLRQARSRGVRVEAWLPGIDGQAAEYDQWSDVADMLQEPATEFQDAVPLWTSCREQDSCSFPARWPEWQTRIRRHHVLGFMGHAAIGEQMKTFLDGQMDNLQTSYEPRRWQPLVIWVLDVQRQWPALWARGGRSQDRTAPSNTSNPTSLPMQLFAPKGMDFDRLFLDRYQRRFHLGWQDASWLPLYTLEQRLIRAEAPSGLTVNATTVVHALSLLLDCEQTHHGRLYFHIHHDRTIDPTTLPTFEVVCGQLHVLDLAARENTVYDLPF